MTVPRNEVLQGDAAERLREIPDEVVDCVVTSPPYWALRDYGVPGQLGLEASWRDHLRALLPVFAQVHRVLKPTGNFFLNYGDTVATGAGASRNPGSRSDPLNPDAQQPANATNRLAGDDPRKHKLGLAWRLRFMLNDELGFISRADIVWHKPNQMPLSVKDRVTPKHEMLFHFVKRPVYWYDLDAIRIPFAASTIQRVNQATFAEQTGGDKDYAAAGMGDSMSSRGALENLAARVRADGAPPGQRPRAHQRASFNIRTRDAALRPEKWGSLATASPEEIEAARAALEPARRDKTLDAPELAPARGAGLRPAPEPGEEGAFCPLGANPGDVWTIPSQPLKEAHFATFPEELVRRRVASGSPLKCCATCGEPWRPVWERSVPSGRPGPTYKEDEAGGGHFAGHAGRGMSGQEYNAFKEANPDRFLALRKSCSCPGDAVVPGLVLDPFMGSGTTALVAKRLGRDFLGTELNPVYVEIARRRVSSVMNHRIDTWEASA